MKRGAGRLALDFESVEARGLPQVSDTRTPDRLYERQWALATLSAALERLRGEYEESPRADLFEALRGTLAGEEPASYAELAARLGMTEGALKTAAHRLRKRYRSALKAQVAETLSDDADPEVELRELLAALTP